MGGCLSSPEIRRSNRTNSLHLQTPMANVISSSGKLLRHKAPITVAQVLRDGDDEQLSDSFILCNSDRLIYGEYIKPMAMEEELQSGQIYFQLPSSRLRHPLTASDMAALAVKATTVLQIIPSTNSDRRKIQKSRICPVVQLEELKNDSADIEYSESGNLRSSSSPLMKSGSVRKSHRFLYRGGRKRMAAGPFKMSLSTIHEDSVLLLYPHN